MYVAGYDMSDNDDFTSRDLTVTSVTAAINNRLDMNDTRQPVKNIGFVRWTQATP